MTEFLPEDRYANWYREDARRTVHSEIYEGRYHHDRRMRVVAAALRRAGVERLIDMGCGDGWQSLRLTRAGYDVVGTDISLERLNRAKSKSGGKVNCFVSDMRQPAIRPLSTDCIYLGQVLEHLPHPESVLKGLRRLLRPGGVLVLDTPCRDNIVDDLFRLLGLDKRHPGILEWGLSIDPGHVRFYRLEEINELLRGAGFEVVFSRGAPRIRWNIPRVGNFLAAKRGFWIFHDLLEGLIGLIPRYRRTGAVVVCVARRPLDEAPSGGDPEKAGD